MPRTVVDGIYEDFCTLVAYLDAGQEISLRSSADENFRKALLLATASYFEHKICDDLVLFAAESSCNCQVLVNFLRNKAIERQYHTFFGWKEARNANSFFGLFGDDFKQHMKGLVDSDDQLRQSIKAFLQLGQDRNRLVHQNYAAFTLEKTAQEIYELYETATAFVESFPTYLREYTEASGGEPSGEE